jgi:hypothetical protein
MSKADLRPLLLSENTLGVLYTTANGGVFLARTLEKEDDIYIMTVKEYNRIIMKYNLRK